MSERRRYQLLIQGVVQGVGFRPYVYNLARSCGLTGWVQNNPRGVVVDIEGQPRQVAEFVRRLPLEKPPLAMITAIDRRALPLRGHNDFCIRESAGAAEKAAVIPADIALCPQCRMELFDPRDRRFQYPFTNCTNCGPRLTIIRDIPYDRAQTTMADFTMCPTCQREYDDPGDRRFHAQPNACPVCGPRLVLTDMQGNVLEDGDPVAAARRLLTEGYIVAVKGLGGFHLACDATNARTVAKLRARKRREEKPFAVMMPSLAVVEKYCRVSAAEAKLLESPQAPIVLLARRSGTGIADGVAPGNAWLGVMLPYTPLHCLLMDGGPEVLVMTSANYSGEPMVYDEALAGSKLAGIADYLCTHNRKIYLPVDDSVARVFHGQPVLVRRSRGYAPLPIVFPVGSRGILACGGEAKNILALGKGELVVLSHHIGDLENMATLLAFEQAVEHYCKLFAFTPEIIACDLHPEYLSTKYALSRPEPKVGVQHHHAHIAGCMAEHELTEEVIGVAFDGTGYGTDGKLWGGEFLVATYTGFTRRAHLVYMPMPGGSRAITEPWRMAVSYLRRAFGESCRELPLSHLSWWQHSRLSAMGSIFAANVACPETSSVGRLFDAVAALLGIRDTITYEGQAAIELEQVAAVSAASGRYSYIIEDTGSLFLIDVMPAIREIVAELGAGCRVQDIAARFHHTVAAMTVDVCRRIAALTGINKVVLSGGVFQNILLLNSVVTGLEQQGCSVYFPRKAPANDGGLALGQVAVASALAKRMPR